MTVLPRDNSAGSFRATIDEIGVRERIFIRTHTRLLEAYPAGSVSVKLDWSAQRWRIPTATGRS